MGKERESARECERVRESARECFCEREKERKKNFLRHLEIYGPGILAAATGGILGKKVEIISRQKNK